MSDNSMMDIKAYLGTPERPVSMEEFSKFWKSLTEEERDEFRKANLN